MLKDQSKYFAENDLYENVLYIEILKVKFKKFLKKKSVINDKRLVVNAIMNVEKYNFEERFVKLNNLRDLIFNKKNENERKHNVKNDEE